MPIIHGNAAYTGVEIKEESAWGTATGNWERVPIISESFRTVRDTLPSSPEFGAIGGEGDVVAISPRVEGEITFSPRLDGRWFHWLMGYFFGTENLDDGNDLAGVGGGALAVNSHWYEPSNQGRSLSIRVSKSGAATGGQTATFSGCIPSTLRIELAPDGLLQMTVGYVGKLEAVATQSGTLETVEGTRGPEGKWLTQNSAGLHTSTSLSEINVRGFTIDVDRQVAADPAFMNSLDTSNQPGPTGNRIVRGTIVGLLEDDYAATDMPYKEWLDNEASACRVYIRDSEQAGSSKYYGMDLDFPAIKWTEADYSVKAAGAIDTSIGFQAVVGTTSSPSHSGDVDMRVGVLVDTTVFSDTYACLEDDTGGWGITQYTS